MFYRTRNSYELPAKQYTDSFGGFSNRTTNIEITDLIMCDVWHAYKYFDIAPDSADIQVTELVCFALTFDTTITILILYSTYYGPTYNRYRTLRQQSRETGNKYVELFYKRK